MTWTLCRAAGEIHLKGLPGLDQAKLSIPGIKFGKPNPPSTWFKYSFIPTDSWRPLGDSAKRRYKGIYQVTVFTPPGMGQAALTMAVDSVVAHFDQKRLALGGVLIDTKDPVPGPFGTETDWESTPITIPFETV